MITFFVNYKFKDEGTRDAFAQGVNDIEMCPKSRAEKGCIRFDYYKPIDDPTGLLLLERWEDLADQKVHAETDHFAKLMEITDKYAPEIDVIEE